GRGKLLAPDPRQPASNAEPDFFNRIRVGSGRKSELSTLREDADLTAWYVDEEPGANGFEKTIADSNGQGSLLHERDFNSLDLERAQAYRILKRRATLRCNPTRTDAGAFDSLRQTRTDWRNGFGIDVNSQAI
ncbi:hypothetical protein N0B51_06480, partial [Tsuneonella sp. YG55]